MANPARRHAEGETIAELRRAYILIKGGQKAEAFDLIKPVLVQQPDVIDAWWLAAFAAPSPRESAFACQKVLMLRPDHWPAQQMLAEQQRRLAISTVLRGEADPSQPTTLLLKTAQRPKPRRAGGLVASLGIAMGILIFFVGGFFLLVNITGNNFGLPIGQMFNAEYDITATVSDQYNDPNALPVAVTGTLVVGARHDYHFTAQVGMVIVVVAQFSAVGNVLPGEALQALDPDGKVIAAARDGSGMAAPLSFPIPRPGVYVLRLTGTAGKAQGTYTLRITVRRAS
jgi:hypothetical protein